MITFQQCKDLPTYSGIYGIRNVTNNKFYIGSAESLVKRLKRHYTYLKKRKSPLSKTSKFMK